MLAKSMCIGKGSLRTGLVLTVLILYVLMAFCPAWGQSGSQGKMVSLDFVAADIHDVLKAISVQSGINVVAGNDVKGEVTISLASVTLTEALDYITKVSGLSYRLVGNAYIVAPAPALRSMFGAQNQLTEVVQVPNGQAAQIQTMAAKVVPEATVGAQGTKALVISGTPEEIKKVKDLVTMLDTRVEPTESEITETYRVRYVDPKSVVASLTQLVPQVKAVVGPDYGFGWYVKSNSGSDGGDEKPKLDSDIIVLTGYPSAIETARGVLAKIDVAPVQINVEAKVAIVDRSNLKNLGITWDWTPFTMNEVAVPDNLLSLGRFQRSAVGVSAELHALMTNGNSRILASPKVTTISNRPAGIFIGDTILYPVTQISQGVATVTVNSIDVGISLKLAAVANDDGHITLSVSTYVSTIRDYLKVGESLFPQVSTRQAQTAIRVKDGESFLIGGLLRDEDIKNIKKMPLLGDIPILGHFFRDVSKTSSQTEIMVFITPRLVKDTPAEQAVLQIEAVKQ